MPYGDPEPEDPHVLVGVSLPADASATREMAHAFADEFAQMGFERERILALFRGPFYAGAHAALQILGEQEVGRLVGESLRVYGGRRIVIRDSEDVGQSTVDSRP
jgi:hypothetical protein